MSTPCINIRRKSENGVWRLLQLSIKVSEDHIYRIFSYQNFGITESYAVRILLDELMEEFPKIISLRDIVNQHFFRLCEKDVTGDSDDLVKIKNET